MFAGAARVVAVVAFAGQNQDQIAWLRQAQDLPGHRFADAADDFGFGLASGPSGLFPLAHLSNADYGNGHGAAAGGVTWLNGYVSYMVGPRLWRWSPHNSSHMLHGPPFQSCS